MTLDDVVAFLRKLDERGHRRSSFTIETTDNKELYIKVTTRRGRHPNGMELNQAFRMTFECHDDAKFPVLSIEVARLFRAFAEGISKP